MENKSDSVRILQGAGFQAYMGTGRPNGMWERASKDEPGKYDIHREAEALLIVERETLLRAGLVPDGGAWKRCEDCPVCVGKGCTWCDAGKFWRRYTQAEALALVAKGMPHAPT